MSDVLNPVEAEAAIKKLGNKLAESVPTVTEMERQMVVAKTALERAEARALLRAEGTVAERQAEVVLAVQAERDAYDVAYIAYRDAERKMRTVRENLSAAQSISASVRAMYGAER